MNVKHTNSFTLKIPETEGEAIASLAALARQSVVAADIETSGLNPFAPGGVIAGLAIYDPSTRDAYYLPLHHADISLGDSDAVRSELEDFLHRGSHIWHNGRFDILHLHKRYGIDLRKARPAGDTRILAKLTIAPPGWQRERKNFYGLKELAKRELGATWAKPDAVGEGQAQHVPAADVAEYAANDVRMTWMLHQHLWKRLDAKGQHLYEALEMAVTPAFVEMEALGVACATQHNLDELEELRQHLVAGLGLRPGETVDGVIRSAKRMNEIIFGELGVPRNPPRLRKSKYGYKLDAHAFQRLAEYHGRQFPVLEDIITYKEAIRDAKQDEGVIEYMQPDGAIHPHWDQVGTDWGGVTSSSPSTDIVRRCLAPQDGGYLLAISYASHRDIIADGWGKKLARGDAGATPWGRPVLIPGVGDKNTYLNKEAEDKRLPYHVGATMADIVKTGLFFLWRSLGAFDASTGLNYRYLRPVAVLDDAIICEANHSMGASSYQAQLRQVLSLKLGKLHISPDFLPFRP